MAGKPRIGVLGLGTMGGAMARRLVTGQFHVTGYDPSPATLARAEADGVTPAASPAAVAAACDVVLSSLPDPATVRRAYLGDNGALAGGRSGMTFIDVSTTDPETWREVAAAAGELGIDCLDAPVSGGPIEAGNGQLVFLVGGDAATLERRREVLGALAAEIHHIGPLGAGQVIKIVNNLMSVGNVVVAAEAMALGAKAGLDPERLFEVLSTSGGRSHHFLKRFPKVLAGDLAPSFSIALSRKDVALGLALAAKYAMPMPIASAVKQTYETAHAEGFG